MYRVLLSLSVLVAIASASIAHSNEPQGSTSAQELSKQQKIDKEQQIIDEANIAAQKAEETARKLEVQIKQTFAKDKNTPAPAATTSAPSEPAHTSSSTTASTSNAPASASSTPAPAASVNHPAASTTVSPPPVPEEPLKRQFVVKKNQSLKTIELNLAKEKAFSRISDKLTNETDELYKAATTQLSSILGKLSDPQSQENYLFNNENMEGGQFEVALVRDSYVKSEKGDICLISTKVSIHTKINSELTPPTALSDASVPSAETESAEQTAMQVPEKYTEIKCFNDRTPTFYQEIIR